MKVSWCAFPGALREIEKELAKEATRAEPAKEEPTAVDDTAPDRGATDQTAAEKAAADTAADLEEEDPRCETVDALEEMIDEAAEVDAFDIAGHLEVAARASEVWPTA